MTNLLRSALVVGLMSALASGPEAQRSLRGLDPSTGKRSVTVRSSRRPSMRPAAASEGPVIGYTTNKVTGTAIALSEFAAAWDDLVLDGHTLVPVDALDTAGLAGIDRLFVGVLGAPLDPADMDAIEAFVRGGGDLIYLGDNNRFWHDQNVQVGGRFGIEYPLSDPREVVLSDIVPHPITRGPFGDVNVVVGTVNAPYFFGSMSSPGPHGRELVLFPDGSSATVIIEKGALAPGAGSIVAISEFNIFLGGYELGDNRPLWRNTFDYESPATRVVFDFQTEDDFETPLANAQGIISPDEFGRIVSVYGLGPNTYGAAIFDSSPTGPNAGGSDPDLLVGLGNILILQESGAQSIPDIYDDLDDAQLGGTFVFDFVEPVQLLSVDLIDICPGPPNQDVAVTLFDQEFRTRTYTVPGGWTNDHFQDGAPGFGTLDLTTLEPQAGFQATASAEQATLFSHKEVVRLEVQLNSSGALDNLVVDTSPEPDPVPFEIVACSLGCVFSGQVGQLACSVTDIAVNEEIGVTFSKPFDLVTADTNTFQVVDLVTGATPPGIFLVDPLDDRTLIWRPRLTFDSAGNPIFGLTGDGAYGLHIPGALLDPLGPYIQSQAGELNETRLSCVVVASQGVMDAVPGRPAVAISVFPGQPAQGATDVARGTDVTLRFDDLMNPATIVNPVTGLSATITVEVDADGNLGTTGDRSVIPGLFTLALDSVAQETTAVFDPTADLRPLALIVVTTGAAIEDLGGNALLNPGSTVFQTAE